MQLKKEDLVAIKSCYTESLKKYEVTVKACY